MLNNSITCPHIIHGHQASLQKIISSWIWFGSCLHQGRNLSVFYLQALCSKINRAYLAFKHTHQILQGVFNYPLFNYWEKNEQKIFKAIYFFFIFFYFKISILRLSEQVFQLWKLNLDIFKTFTARLLLIVDRFDVHC
jgi:hypothetical protein